MLEVQSLACRRSGRIVFRDLGFSLGAGDALVVTGANGSGKSSLLRTLAGLLPSMTGSIVWRGQNIAEEPDAYRGSIHYIGHLDSVKLEMTVTETLNYWCALRSAVSPLQQDPFGILALRDKPVRYLSAGQKRRLTLSRLMLTDASLWLLDEPSLTLDIQGQAILADCIKKHRAEGGMAIIATHQELGFSDAVRYEMKGVSRV